MVKFDHHLFFRAIYIYLHFTSRATAPTPQTPVPTTPLRCVHCTFNCVATLQLICITTLYIIITATRQPYAVTMQIICSATHLQHFFLCNILLSQQNTLPLSPATTTIRSHEHLLTVSPTLGATGLSCLPCSLRFHSAADARHILCDAIPLLSRIAVPVPHCYYILLQHCNMDKEYNVSTTWEGAIAPQQNIAATQQCGKGTTERWHIRNVLQHGKKT